MNNNTESKQILDDAIKFIINYNCRRLEQFKEEMIEEKYAPEVIDENKEELKELMQNKGLTPIPKGKEKAAIEYLITVINNNLHDWTELYEMHLESERTKGKCSDADLYECKCCPPRKMKCLDDFDI